MKVLVSAVVLILVSGSLFGGYFMWKQQNISAITSFEDCIDAGYPAMYSKPAQCKTPEGKIFEDNSTSSGIISTPNPDTTPTPGGEEITVEGEVVCLPYKSQGGAQTMECAYGLRVSDGKYYALSDPNWKYLMGVGTGSKVKITGISKAASNTKYDTVGTIEISTLVKL